MVYRHPLSLIQHPLQDPSNDIYIIYVNIFFLVGHGSLIETFPGNISSLMHDVLSETFGFQSEAMLLVPMPPPSRSEDDVNAAPTKKDSSVSVSNLAYFGRGVGTWHTYIATLGNSKNVNFLHFTRG